MAQPEAEVQAALNRFISLDGPIHVLARILATNLLPGEAITDAISTQDDQEYTLLAVTSARIFQVKAKIQQVAAVWRVEGIAYHNYQGSTNHIHWRDVMRVTVVTPLEHKDRRYYRLIVDPYPGVQEITVDFSARNDSVRDERRLFELHEHIEAMVAATRSGPATSIDRLIDASVGGLERHRAPRWEYGALIDVVPKLGFWPFSEEEYQVFKPRHNMLYAGLQLKWQENLGEPAAWI